MTLTARNVLAVAACLAAFGALAAIPAPRPHSNRKRKRSETAEEWRDRQARKAGFVATKDWAFELGQLRNQLSGMVQTHGNWLRYNDDLSDPRQRKIGWLHTVIYDGKPPGKRYKVRVLAQAKRKTPKAKPRFYYRVMKLTGQTYPVLAQGTVSSPVAVANAVSPVLAKQGSKRMGLTEWHEQDDRRKPSKPKKRKPAKRAKPRGRCAARGEFIFPDRKAWRFAVPDQQCAQSALSQATGRRMDDVPDVVTGILKRIQKKKLPRNDALLTHVAVTLDKYFKAHGLPDEMRDEPRLKQKRKRARRRAA
jgi:hypothetical protein